MGSKNIGCKLVTRPFILDKDYVTIESWWIKHCSFAPKPEHLSETGIIVEVDEEPACAGWIYKTDSSFCIFEFVVSNPDLQKDKRDLALSKLIEFVKQWAKDNGFTIIYSSIGIKSYIKRLKDGGFIVADTNQTHLFCEIGK